MITITGTAAETDYIIEQLACGACEGCPAQTECKGAGKRDKTDDGLSCGELIRRHIKIINER